MKNQIEENIAQNTRLQKSEPLKAVTFMLPARVADLIEATRGQLEGQWEEGVASLAGAIERESFEACKLEFEDQFVNNSWTHESDTDRAQFMEPLLAALRIAHSRQHALVESALA